MKTTCDHCGKVADCSFTCDPYQEEINNIITEETYWCDECYHDAIMEI